MVHFLKHHHSDLQIDVVEIDPVIVKIADEYFGIRSEGNTRIITEDGFKYLQRTDQQYDVIYMDAFLNPSAGTDKTGVPVRLKTARFLKGLRQKLSPDGLVVFNLNIHRNMRKDIETIRAAFPTIYAFDVPQNKNRVVVGSLATQREKSFILKQRGRELDRRLQANFSFEKLVRHLRR